jgi:hypothetical protein
MPVDGSAGLNSVLPFLQDTYPPTSQAPDNESYISQLLGEPEPQPPPIVPTTEIPDKLREQIEDYAKTFCCESRKVVKKKESRYKLMDALYNGEIGIRQWKHCRLTGEDPDLDIHQEENDKLKDPEDWQSNYIYEAKHIVDQPVYHGYTSIFSGPDYLVIFPEPAPDWTPDPQQISDIQKLFLYRLEEGKIHSRVWDSLKSMVTHGTCYAMCFAYSDRNLSFYKDLETGKIQKEVNTAPPIPVIQIIPPDQALPDTRSHHNDIQRHRGFGFWQHKDIDAVLDGFRKGTYNLNEEAFKKAYPVEEGEQPVSDEKTLFDNKDQEESRDIVKKCRVWEWHGRASTDEGFVESVVTFVTPKGQDETSEAIVIRCLPEPLLTTNSGRPLRPFAMASYNQKPGYDADGAIGEMEDTLYQLSRFIGRIQDSLNVTVTPAYSRNGVNPELDAWLEEHSYTICPGDVTPGDMGGGPGISPLAVPNIPVQQAYEMVQLLKGVLEEGTATKDINLGLQRHETPATTASIIQQQGMAPVNSILDLYARNFLGPLCTIALHLIAQLTEEDQTVYVPKADNSFESITVPVQALKRGGFRVVPTLTRQDASRVAKAQIIKELIQLTPEILPALQQEGMIVSIAELYNRLIDLLGVDGAERIARKMTQQEIMQAQMAQQQEMMMAQQGGGGGGGQGQPMPPLPPGGDMGPPPTDPMAMAALLQSQAQMGAPV